MKVSLCTMFGRFLPLFSLIAVPILASPAADAAQLRTIEHTVVAPGSEEVRLGFDEAVEPKVFTMDEGKPRVVLDFPGTTRAAGARNLSPGSAVVKAVRVGVDKNRMRLVCDVTSLKGLDANVRLEGEQVVISLSGSGAATASPAETAAPARLAPTPKRKGPGADRAVAEDGPVEPAPPAMPEASAAPETPAVAEKPAAPIAPPPAPEPPAGPPVPGAPADAVDTPYLSAIQFDPDSPRGELVQFKLNGFYPPVLRSVESGAPQVICEFGNMEVAPALEGPIKLSGRLVKGIRLDRSPDSGKVRVFVELEPNRHYDLQQVFFKEDNFFVLMINTAKQ